MSSTPILARDSTQGKKRIMKGEFGESKRYIQLTLEQHGFELHGATYMWIFFNSKYYSIT